MPVCVRCRIDLPDAEFHSGSRGRPFKTCRGCRKAAPDEVVKRRCAGAPGHKCRNMITDYRCTSCWKKVRSVDLGAHHTELDFPGMIHTANW